MINKTILLFLMATFSMTQIRLVGYIGISELVMAIIGPYLLFKNWKNLRRDGLGTFLILDGLWIFSALITDWYREIPLKDVLRGVASPLMILFVTPCVYVLLKADVRKVKWAVVGFALTTFLSVFVIQKGTDYGRAEMLGVSSVEAAIEYKLTLVTMVMSVGAIIPSVAYLRMPHLSFFLTLCVAIYSLYSGGRSMFLSLLISSGLMFLVGGKITKIKHVRRLQPIMIITALLLVFLAKKGYEYAATHDYMGEDERQKYETQSKSKIGLLMGRGTIVDSALAIWDSPFIGHGSWALDYKGFNVRALEWLEDDKALEEFYKMGSITYIQGHSHILTAYIWHGFFGGVFWVYVLWVVWRTFRLYLGIVPELYGYLAFTLPYLIWNILFSPFGDRVATITLLTVCLMLNKFHRLNDDKCKKCIAEYLS